jgi:hypothetical protein
MSATVHLLRAAVAIVLAGGLFAVYRIARGIALSRARDSATRLAAFTPGVPGIVFFTTADCVTCKAAQRPALRAIAGKLPGRVQIIEVDAVDNPEVAADWSVLTVPTTYVVDSTGRPRQVNHGFAPEEKLLAQLGAVT